MSAEFGSLEHKKDWLEIWRSTYPSNEAAEEGWELKMKLAGNPVQAGHYVMGDIEPYQSMIDGSIIGSRSKHRTHLKDHGCIELGNEKLTPKAMSAPPGLKQRLIEVAHEKLRYN
jgi:hypothetical protein